MEYTRVDTKKLVQALDKAAGHLDQALELLAPYTVVLDEAQRATLLKPRDSFPSAAEAVLAEASAPQFKELLEFAAFDSEAVAEDLANVKALAKLEGRMSRIAQRLADSRLLWLAEAYAPLLELYALVKAKAKSDPEVSTLVAPLADAFASPSKRTPKV